MADPSLTVDSKNDVFKNPIGFVPHLQETTLDASNKFNKESSLIKGIARSVSTSIANNMSNRIALETQMPRGKLPRPSLFNEEPNKTKNIHDDIAALGISD